MLGKSVVLNAKDIHCVELVSLTGGRDAEAVTLVRQANIAVT